MKIKLSLCVVGLISLCCLFGSWESYRPSILAASLSKDLGFAEKPQVSMVAKAYNSEDSIRFLDRNVNSRGYQPIQVTITNQSAKSFSISASGFNTPSSTVDEVAGKILKSAIPRSAAYSVASLLFWPFMIPGAINSIKTLKAHAKLKHDFMAKIVKDEVILPFSTVYRVLFVEEEKVKDIQGVLSLTLIDLDTLKPTVCESELG